MSSNHREQDQVMNIKKEATDLYIRFELPRTFYFLESLLESTVHRKWFVPSVLVSLMLLKRSNAIKYFIFEKREWVKKVYRAKDLAPFYPQVGDIPQKYHYSSLEEMMPYVKKELQRSEGKSINKIKYWLKCKKIPPIIVIYPPPKRSPYKEAKGYILDGNHRAIAMAFKTGFINAYVGNKNNVLQLKPYSEKYKLMNKAHKYHMSLQNICDMYVTKLELDFIINLLNHNKLLPINYYIDVATGPGRIISEIEKYSHNNVGLDISNSMLMINKKTTLKTNLLKADVLSLPLNTDCLELITCFRLFINLSKNDKKSFLLECKRVLKNNGLLVFDVHVNKIGLSGIIGSIKGYISSNSDDLFKRYNLISPYSLKKILHLYSYENFEVLHSFFPLLSRFSILPPRLQFKLDNCLVRIPFIQNFSDMFVVAVKVKK